MDEDMEEHMGHVFSAYGTPMTAVSSFWYLGRKLLSTDDDWPTVEWNLWRVQRKWGRQTKIFGREGADNKMAGRFYVAVVQAVLLFGSKTWVLSPCLEKALEGFYHRAAWLMAVMGPKRQPDGMWVYPPIGAALTMLVMEEIGVYIARRQNTVAKYIVNCPIMDLCLAADRNNGMRLPIRWW